MRVKQQIDQDLKAALLGGNKALVTTLRGLKGAILNAEIEAGKRESGLEESANVTVLRKEVKKRQESADLYNKGGSPEKAQAELAEVQMIEKYLPPQISDEELEKIVDRAVRDIGEYSMSAMGKIIARAKELVGEGADSSRIAAIAKQKVAVK